MFFGQRIPRFLSGVKTRIIIAFFTAGMIFACSPAQSEHPGSWDPKAAAAYLDEREAWWMQWPVAARDQGTFCVSCHTTLPYALSRSALRHLNHEEVPTLGEQRLIESVRKRVRIASNDSAHKNDESDGTQAILNALVLAAYDSQAGKLGDDTRTAFENMWSLQQTAGDKQGAWLWVQANLQPWETKDSYYYGATLAAVAVGTAPESYRLTPAIQKKIELLRDYLRREYVTQSSINRVGLLWASTKLPDLIQKDQQQVIISDILRKQNADGGWSLPSLISPGIRQWIRRDFTPQSIGSDAYATGLISFVLEQTGFSQQNEQIARALSWLARHQRKEGVWQEDSLNKWRRSSDPALPFMSDAATAYAVLALTEATE
jgi:squalene-hopene/tetraprenyl-beta-curcumene cyclase